MVGDIVEFKINDTYKVITDKHNFILQRKEEVKKRDKTTNKLSDEVEFTFKDAGYFPSLPMALHRFLNEKIRDLDTTDIQTIIRTIKQAEKEITEATKHLKNDYVSTKNNNEESDNDE